MQKYKKRLAFLAIFGSVAGAPMVSKAEPQKLPSFQACSTFDAPNAKQAVAVDKNHFYAINNTVITKQDKKTGEVVAEWRAPQDWPIFHFDSGMVRDGKLYLAHSNFPDRPMTSSVEVFNTKTMRHIDKLSHSFGIERGSFTWLDRDPQGRWWGAFGNYDRVVEKDTVPYGGTINTQIVRFDKNWNVEESFILPKELLSLFGDMSNSGGSWGKDGKLYITGHDEAEVYVLEEPEAGSIMRWVGTIDAPVTGQGISWDRSQKTPVLFGIQRAAKDSKDGNKVVALAPGCP